MALALGKTVHQLLAETTSAELADWMAYYQIEPFGESAADMRHGIATATLANINRNDKAPPYHPQDFIPWSKQTRKDEGELLTDPKAQAALIRKKLFKAR